MKNDLPAIEDLFKPVQKTKVSCQYTAMLSGLFDRNYTLDDQAKLKHHLEDCDFCLDEYKRLLASDLEMKNFIPDPKLNFETAKNLKLEIADVLSQNFAKKISKRIQNASGQVAKKTLKSFIATLF